MRPNRIQEIWRNGGAVVNGWLTIPSSFSAELMAHAGFDSLTVDMQHGPIHYDSALPMLQALSTTEVTPLARVPWNEPGIIMKMLDAGCYGIICPMVNTRDEAEAFVQACRYPPLGYRSYGPTRVRLYAGDDYAENANATVLTIAMIETAQALENVEAIVSTPELDGIYIGPADLSQSLGHAERVDLTEPALVEALDRILAAAKKYSVAAGLHVGSTAYARQMIEKGFQFVTLQADGAFLTHRAKQVVEEMRGAGAGSASASSPY